MYWNATRKVLHFDSILSALINVTDDLIHNNLTLVQKHKHSHCLNKVRKYHIRFSALMVQPE